MNRKQRIFIRINLYRNVHNYRELKQNLNIRNNIRIESFNKNKNQRDRNNR